MAGTIVTDRIESDASYASSVNIASPLVIANTISMTNGNITGNVNIDSGTLFVDGVGNKVGIGTSTPLQKLDIFGNAIRMDNGSYVGYIGSQLALNASGAASDFTLRSDNAITLSTGGPYERLRIDTAGRLTVPNQPAFFAHHTEGGNSSKPRTSEWTSGAYNSVVFNRGNHFSGARFTAPVTGLYYFHFWVQEETFYGTWTTPISIYWWKNGSAAFSYGIDSPGIQESENEAWIAGSIIIELAANDTFSASLYAPNASTGGNPWISTELNSGGFMGYLIG